MSSMKDRLDAGHAAAWKPDPGDELIGKIVGLGRRTTEWGTYTVVTVEPEGGGDALAFHAYHKVAAQQLESEQPSIGDEIGIRYEGKRTSETSQYGGYQSYKIIVDHPAGWSPPPIPATGSEAPPLPPEDAPVDDIPF